MRTGGERTVYTVSELNRLARRVLEEDLPAVCVEGEVSNLARPASGHIYFSLKDERAQIRCAMFRSAARGATHAPANGDQVMVRGRVSLYEPRGDYQLLVDHVEAAGEGLLRRRFEALKQRLAAEGLFDAARKRPLPPLPRCIGVVTSPTGAAIRDILHILRRRFPAVPVVIYPVAVQGAQARFEISMALETAARRAECDVLIVARGGGSLEDLWPFNEEQVARAIGACPIPVIAGVGHEIDFTIADLVADVRAPTPSGAAELAVPDRHDWLRRLASLDGRLAGAARRLLAERRTRHSALEARLARARPGFLLRQHGQRLDELRQRLVAGIQRSLREARRRHAAAGSRLQHCTPLGRLREGRDALAGVERRLHAAITSHLQRSSARLAVLGGRLNTVSPLATLERGYALAQDATGTPIRDAAQVAPGDPFTVRLARGTLDARVVRRSG